MFTATGTFSKRLTKPLLILSAVASLAAHAQSGDILIGMSLPLSGFNASAGQDGLNAAKAAIAVVNQAGGIHGRKLSIVAMDDEFSPAKAAENAKALDERGVLALFNCWGTASCSSIMPIVNERQLPLVAGIAGGGPMRSEPGRYVFNVRPTTVDEIARMVNQMLTIGQTRIALAYQDDPFGKSGQAAAKVVFEKAALKSALEAPLARDGSNAAAVVQQIKDSGANGVVIVASPQATVTLIGQARKAGLAIQFYNLAAQANRKLVADLGDNTRGVVFTTTVPSPWKNTLPIVKEYQQAIVATLGKEDFSYLGLEVFINTQVLIEGIKRAGPKMGRNDLLNALESMPAKRFSDAMSIKYGPNDRKGSSYVGLTIIGNQGKFIE